MIEPVTLNWPAGERWLRRFLVAGLLGTSLCTLAALLDVRQLMRSYLFAYFAWLGISLGSLGLWMLHNLTGGDWGLVLRRIWEAASRTLPGMAVLFVPIALGMSVIYPWAGTDAGELGSKMHYLNVPFFLTRAAFYFALWVGLAFFLNRWSAAHDRTGDPACLDRAQLLSGPGLLLCGLSVTFAAIDWVMSLEPDWYSTIFGAMVATGDLLAALALAIAVATMVFSRGSQIPVSAWNDLGNLLLAFVMLWTYMEFSQYLLIWSGNLLEEITWYLHRTEGGWQWIGLSLAVGYFALPFCLLLSYGVKQRPERLRRLAILVVAMSFVNNYWLIAPAFSPSRFDLSWTDPVAFVAVGGLWLAMFLRELRARPIMPIHEAVLKEAPSHA